MRLHTFLSFRFFFICIAFLAFFCCLSSTVTAATYYVKPSAEIPVRRGASTGHKIIAIIKSGVAVTYIREDKGWAFIQLSNGKQGWILRRFLSTTPPPDQQIINLQEEKKTLVEKITQLETQIETFKQGSIQTGNDLNACLAEYQEVNDKYIALMSDTADVAETKAALEEARLTIAQLEEQNSALDLENKLLHKSKSMLWFLAGATIMLLGWLLGRLGRTKQRSSNRRRIQ